MSINIFASVIVHEMGHQLGLDHEKSVGDLMFGFGDGSRAERAMWLNSCARNALSFTKKQISVMQTLLATP